MMRVAIVKLAEWQQTTKQEMREPGRAIRTHGKVMKKKMVNLIKDGQYKMHNIMVTMK